MEQKFKELLDKMNELKLIQTSIDWAESLPDEIWKEHFENNFMELKDGLNIQKHRWYETSITVIQIYDNLLGIRRISNLFSESSSCEDCYVTMEFFEMKEVTEITYHIK